jgi:DNA-binding transcriptional ArsR family regulator
VKGDFLRGPIPTAWLKRACDLPGGRAIAVALALWWLAGVRGRKDELRLTSKVLGRLGVADRSAKSRALLALEEAGLVSVRRRPRKNPLVSILEVRTTPAVGGTDPVAGGTDSPP